jgi:hypothetical protein
MGKILAIVFLILFVWLAIPRIVQGEWLAPTAIAPNSWVVQYDTTGLAEASAAPAAGFGWFHFDFWNHPTTEGQPVTTQDLNFRSPRSEF